jgi:hypothetical protein
MTQQTTQAAEPATGDDGVVTQQAEPSVQAQDQAADDAGEPAQAAEPDAVSQLAMELGWNPEFAGPEAVDARTFILRSREINDRLSKRVRGMSKELSALREGVDTIRWSVEQQSKQEISKLKAEISSLKTRRDQALTAGEADQVRQYDAQIEALQAATVPPERPPVPTTAGSPVFDTWVEHNTWYETDTQLQQYADNLSRQPEYQAMPYELRLDRVATAVKGHFPDRFKRPGAPAPSTNAPPVASAAVAPVSPSRQRAKPSAKAKVTAADLSYDQRRVGEDFVSMGVYKSLDEYAQQLAAKSEQQVRS